MYKLPMEARICEMVRHFLVSCMFHLSICMCAAVLPNYIIMVFLSIFDRKIEINCQNVIMHIYITFL